MHHRALIIVLVASILGCNSDRVNKAIQSNDKFTANSYKEVAKASGNGNFVVSGLSAEIILSLLANGAKGKTQSQLLHGLELTHSLDQINEDFDEITSHLNINTEDLKLLTANKLFPAKGFNILKPFNDTAVNRYHSDVETVDYNNAQVAVDTINKWVEDQTNNKIKELIDVTEVDSSTVLIGVNALYFSGKWEEAFEDWHTAKKPFYGAGGSTKDIDTMHGELYGKYSYNEHLKAKFLELGFQGGDISMTFVLPDSKTGLGDVETNLADYLQPQKMENAKIEVTLPKFTIETTIDYADVVKSFGVEDIFTDKADLSGISGDDGLYVSFIVQKAFIDVNEEGVEAAAATGFGIVPESLDITPTKYSFIADHPFLFLIRENTSGVTLFAGRFNQ